METKDKRMLAGVIILGLLVLVYIGGSIFFLDHFFPRTMIDGRQAGWRSPKYVMKVLEKDIRSYALTISTRDGHKEVIQGEDIDLEPRWTGTVEGLISEQNVLAWPVLAFCRHDMTSRTLVDYDTDKLLQRLYALEFMDQKNQKEPENATFTLKEDGKGYTVKPGRQGTTIDRNKMIQTVEETVSALYPKLSLEKAGVYVEPKITEDDPKLAKAIEKLNKYAKSSITYKIGKKREVLDVDTFGSWFRLDDNGKLKMRQKKIDKYVSGLAKKYNTCYTAKKLKTSYGPEVTIPVSHYGWKVDEEAEKKKIIKEIKAGKPVTRKLKYSMTANSHGVNDYGDSYVEINLTAQHVFLYKNGKLVIDTDCVSGNLAKGCGSPTGAFGIYYTQKDAILRGDNYRTPVSYWMPFSGGVGLHDATWRRGRFGGSIYKYNGSHGCINLPVSAAKVIFENVEKNYPVLVYELPGSEKMKPDNAKSTENEE